MMQPWAALHEGGAVGAVGERVLEGHGVGRVPDHDRVIT